MKTPEEFKKNLVVCMDEAIEVAENGDAHDLLDFAHHAHARLSETLTHIQQLEANWHQVSKALCGKENATLDELLQDVDQAKQNKPGTKLICEITIDGEEILRKAIGEVGLYGKTIAEWIELTKEYKQFEQDLATVKQERDAAVSTLHGDCDVCMFQQTAKCDSCRYGINHVWEHDCWEWEGISPDTEVKPNE